MKQTKPNLSWKMSRYDACVYASAFYALPMVLLTFALSMPTQELGALGIPAAAPPSPPAAAPAARPKLHGKGPRRPRLCCYPGRNENIRHFRLFHKSNLHHAPYLVMRLLVVPPNKTLLQKKVGRCRWRLLLFRGRAGNSRLQ